MPLLPASLRQGCWQGSTHPGQARGGGRLLLWLCSASAESAVLLLVRLLTGKRLAATASQ